MALAKELVRPDFERTLEILKEVATSEEGASAREHSTRYSAPYKFAGTLLTRAVAELYPSGFGIKFTNGGASLRAGFYDGQKEYAHGVPSRDLYFKYEPYILRPGEELWIRGVYGDTDNPRARTQLYLGGPSVRVELRDMAQSIGTTASKLEVLDLAEFE